MLKFIRNLLIIAAFAFSTDAFAQQNTCTISGQIIESGSNVVVPFATAQIFDGEKSITGVIADIEGKFTLQIELDNSQYTLSVTALGYEDYNQTIIADKAEIDMGTIMLQPDMLNDSIIFEKIYRQSASMEKTTINASANMTSQSGTAIDLLRQASSVSILNDEISIRGNSNILVLMDGIPTTTTDLAIIPAASIKSIEVISNPDASYDASGTGGIINIISKKASLEGLSGIVSANYGFNHFANANAAVAYNTTKASYRFNYNTRYEDDVINSSLQRYVKATGYDVNQTLQSTRYTYNNNIGLGADFRFNPKNRLSLDVKFILPRLNIRQDVHNAATNMTAEEFRHNDVTWNRENLDASLSYTHVFKPEVSDITVMGSISKIWGHRPSYYYLNDQKTGYSNSGGSPFIANAQVDYKHKFNVGTLSAGAKLTYRHNEIFHEFYQADGDGWTNVYELSNDLDHTYWLPSAYVMFGSRIGKKFTYKAGIRTEVSCLSMSSVHNGVTEKVVTPFLLPSLSASYKLSDKQSLDFALSRRIGYPTYPQLNPYMSMVDATTFEQGNMYLQPEKGTKVDLSYSLSSGGLKFFADGYLNYTADYISQITTFDGNKLITTYVNVASDLKTGLDLSLNVDVTSWFNILLAANTYYVTSNGEYKGAVISNRGVTNNSNITLDFNTWRGMNIQCQYFVTTPQYFPQLTTALTHQMNVGIKQHFYSVPITVSLLMTDVFNTARWEVSSFNNVFDLTNISRNKSRMLWLGISYNFNSFKQKSGKKADNDRSLIRLGL